MPQVNALGTTGEFTQSAKKFGLDADEIAKSARHWFEGQVKAPVTTYYSFKAVFDGKQVSFKAALKYDAKKYHLTCMKIERA